MAKSLKTVLVSNGCSTVVEHSSHYLKVKSLSPATTAGTGREKKGLKEFGNFWNMVVEPSPCHPKVKALSPVTTAGQFSPVTTA
jgi:hypothetical protein